MALSYQDICLLMVQFSFDKTVEPLSGFDCISFTTTKRHLSVHCRQGRNRGRFPRSAPRVLVAALRAPLGGVRGADAVVGPICLRLREGEGIYHSLAPKVHPSDAGLMQPLDDEGRYY